MATDQQHFDRCREFQEYYDQALRKVGARAPQPILGQTVNAYRREALRNMKRTFLPQNHPLYQVQMRDLRSDALNALEPQVLKVAVEEANNPAHVPPGELRKIEERDDTGTLKMIRFVGQHSFVKDMMRPGRRVAQFITDRGRYNVAKARYE